MGKDRTVTLRVPESLLAAALHAARAEEMTAPDFIRAAIADRVAACAGAPRDPIAALRVALRRDFASAAGWIDLQRRLRARMLVLRAGEGGLWLHTWPVEHRLVPLARLGLTREDLTLHYRAAFPADGRDSPKSGAGRGSARAGAAEPAPAGAATWAPAGTEVAARGAAPPEIRAGQGGPVPAGAPPEAGPPPAQASRQLRQPRPRAA